MPVPVPEPGFGRRASSSKKSHALAICHLFAALAVILSSCAAAPPLPSDDPRPVISAFRDCLETYYAAKLHGPEVEAALAGRRAESGARLVSALAARGTRIEKAAAERGLAGLVPYVERYLHTRTEDVAFAEVEPGASPDEARRRGAAAFPGSFLIGGGARREAGREVALAGREARYALVTYGEELCPPYDVWRRPGAADLPRVFVIGGAIYAARERFPEGEAALEQAVRMASAALLFPGAEDRDRRDARMVVALLDGEDGAAALRLARAAYPAPAARLVLEAARTAGIGASEPDPALLARLERLSSAERHAIVKSAIRPGGLLDTSDRAR